MTGDIQVAVRAEGHVGGAADFITLREDGSRLTGGGHGGARHPVVAQHPAAAIAGDIKVAIRAEHDASRYKQAAASRGDEDIHEGPGCPAKPPNVAGSSTAH